MPSPLWSVVMIPLATAAAAQEPTSSAAAPTVEQYLCTFAGKCDGVTATPAATRVAPRTRGFRLARPTADARATIDAPRPTAAAARPTRSTPTYGRTARRNQAPAAPGYVAPATPSYVAAAPAASAGDPVGRRANLLIGFELNSDQLSAQGQQAAQVFARSLLTKELRGHRFMIEGHTDLRGGRALNNALSAQRAQAVTNYLVSLGVERDRLMARGFGYSAPLPGRRVTDPDNRRVEAELIS